MLFKASAPGSLMLLGEYAVLYGQHALVCAIDKRMTVTLSPRDDRRVIIESALGQHHTTLQDLTSVPPFQFVLAALHKMKKYFKCGCDLKIESEFAETVGFASSAAVTVATLSVLSTWFGLSLTEHALIKLAREVVRHVQGTGSGADVAACVLGGIVSYRMAPFFTEKFSSLHPIQVIYSGYKTPTVAAIARVQENFLHFPQLFRHLCQAINSCTSQGVLAIKKEDWRALGQVMNIQQGLMESLGVNTPDIRGIINNLRQQPGILGAKISGSGLGDCVVALGEGFFADEKNIKKMDVRMANQGVLCEKI